MKKALALLAVVLTLGMTTAMDAQAKRLGGGKSAGMQRQNVTPPPANPAGVPGNAATQSAPAAGATAAAAAPAAAAAAAPKRSWMGPIAGLAAGLGLAALASHFGFGEALANMMMIGLAVMAVLLVVGLIMRKRAAAQSPALAGAGMNRMSGMNRMPEDSSRTGGSPVGGSLIGSRIGGGLGGMAAASTQPGNIPADFDTSSFVRNAKEQFMGLQKANDARDLDRLRDYLTPEMLELARADLDARGDAPQTTEVFGLEAQVLDVAEEADRYVVSVRFTGSTRDQAGAVPEDLDEIWHLTKPRAGFGGWVIAGIQQSAQHA